LPGILIDGALLHQKRFRAATPSTARTPASAAFGLVQQGSLPRVTGELGLSYRMKARVTPGGLDRVARRDTRRPSTKALPQRVGTLRLTPSARCL
jgi:hypothetical protein